MKIFVFTVLTAALIFSCSAAYAINMKAITEDVSLGDKDFPPNMTSFAFQVQEHDLYGIVYVAEGKGPHPTAFVLHGFPGNEKTLDLAQALRRAGINAVFFTYRGAWGSEGNFTYQNCIEDTMAAIDFFKTEENARKFRVDPENFIVMGHSMGGFITMNVAKLRQDVKACVYLSGWNIGYEGKRLASADAETIAARKQGLAASAVPLQGTSADALMEEILSMKDTHDLISFVPELKGKKVLMITAKQDTGYPAETDHTPLYDALKKAYPEDITEAFIDTDHVYSGTRMEMIRCVFDWLQSIGY